MSIYMSRAELEEISEGLITAYANKFSNRVIQSIDIEHFITEFLMLRIEYASFAEDDAGRIGFLADGATPLLIHQDGKIIPFVFPKDTIVLDKFLLAEKEQGRRRFTMAHEASHHILSKMYGKVLDENYSQILFANPDFDLETVFLIDCVQKRIKIDKEAIKHLRKLKVIEGKSPNIFLSASVSETIGEQSQYVKNKAFNDQYYRDLIVKYLEQYGSAKKRDVRELLWDKLPEVMDDKQKESKVKNLLAQMRRTGIITTDSENQQKSSWILVKDLNK